MFLCQFPPVHCCRYLSLFQINLKYFRDFEGAKALLIFMTRPPSEWPFHMFVKLNWSQRWTRIIRLIIYYNDTLGLNVTETVEPFLIGAWIANEMAIYSNRFQVIILNEIY